jgi:hypothetical protein
MGVDDGRMRPLITNSTEGPIDAFNQSNGRCRVETVGICLSSVLGQRRDTPDNKEWSGRWESNPRGRRFRAFKTSGLARMLMPSVISV